MSPHHRRKVSLGFRLILIILGIASVSVVFWVMRSVIPLVPGLLQPGVWTGEEPFRYAIVDPQITTTETLVVAYYPKDRQVIVVKIPAQLAIETAGHYGNYRIGSLYKLGVQEKLGTGLVQTSLTKALGMPIRAVVVMPMTISATPDQLIKQSAWRLVSMPAKNHQAMVKDTVRVWWQLRQVTEAQIKTVTLVPGEVADRSTDVDGSELYVLNETKMMSQRDAWQQNYLLSNQALTMAVENTTAFTGLAWDTATIVQGDGWDVVKLADGQNMLPNTIIEVGDRQLLTHYLVRDLRWLFPEAVVRVESTAAYRSDVVIKLGVKGRGWWE